MREFLKQLFFAAEDLMAEGKHAIGIKAYRAALHEAKKDDFEEFLALGYLVDAYDETGKQNLAMEYAEKARQLALKLYGSDSPIYAVAINNVAMLNSNHGRVEAAEPLLDEAIAILQSTKTKVPLEFRDFVKSNIVEVYANASDCKAKLGHVDLAVNLMRQCYAWAKSNLHPGSGRRLQAGVELGAMLASTGQAKEAGSIKNEILRDLQRMGLGTAEAFDVLEHAIVSARAMLQSFDEYAEQVKPKGKRKSKPKVVSNVVPFVRT